MLHLTELYQLMTLAETSDERHSIDLLSFFLQDQQHCRGLLLHIAADNSADEYKHYLDFRQSAIYACVSGAVF